LNENNDLENYLLAVKPAVGNLLVFKRAGTLGMDIIVMLGLRRAIQINWVLHENVLENEQSRHSFSSKLKVFQKLSSIFIFHYQKYIKFFSEGIKQ
jgi:SM-20-related protein